MHKFELNKKYHARGNETEHSRIGEIYHVSRNTFGGGSVSTPIARYFAWRPEYIEGVNPHWRIDCFVREHKLAGNPKKLAQMLAAKLVEHEHCGNPIWISWHKSIEVGGEKRGELFEEN
ncbi:MAG: hypothetical protein ABJQ34_15435 [Paracoccaceae bacterium]